MPEYTGIMTNLLLKALFLEALSSDGVMSIENESCPQALADRECHETWEKDGHEPARLCSEYF